MASKKQTKGKYMNLLLENLLDLHARAHKALDNITKPRNIEVQVAQNEQDWEFVAIKDKNGYHVAVF